MKYFSVSLTILLCSLVISCSGRAGSDPNDPQPKFYSEDTPGKWQVQTPTHVPRVEKATIEGKPGLRVVVPLEATPTHYIEAILLTDKDHRELVKKSLGRSQAPEATLPLPDGDYKKLYVVIKCNLHDMWEVQYKP